MRASTFEVVMKKPEHDPVIYEKPLPLDLLPYQERTDAYRSLGTAFALGNNTYVTAAHVIGQGIGSQYGPPALRNSEGTVYAIDRILKFSRHEDFVVFSLREDPKAPGLPVDREPKLDETVLAVGNALGDGIVIRDGLLTSQTPEAQDGRWKWLRFSAAASPGNSGGPLCDANGRVLGIVVLKSPNENLNYALPIANVLDAPAGKARFDERSAVALPFLHDTISYTFKDEFTLPLPWASFVETYRAVEERHEEESLHKLLAAHVDTFFPRGPGAENLLFEFGPRDASPRLITQKADGSWAAPPLEFRDSSQLPGDGSVSSANALPARIVRLVRSGGAADDAFYGDSKAFMDLALRTLDLRRVVGTDRVRLTSLGPARSDTPYTDPYGRRWQERIWAVPHEDGYLVGMLLPTPDGYSAIILWAPSISLHLVSRLAELLAAQLEVSYEGSLAQWQAFLGRRALLPESLAGVKLEKSPLWTLRTSRFVSGVPAGVLPLTAQSPMMLLMGFTQEPQRTVLEPHGVWWFQDARRTAAIGVRREARPPASAELELRNQFDSLAQRRAPFDGTLSRESAEVFSATTVLDVPGTTAGTLTADLAYALTLAGPDYPGMKDSSRQLKEVREATQVLERGAGAHALAGTPETTSERNKALDQLHDRLAGLGQLDEEYGGDLRGRHLSDDLRDFETRVKADVASVSPGTPAAATLRDEDKSRLEDILAYWRAVPVMRRNAELWSSFLANNQMPATTPHGAKVAQAEAALREALAGSPSADWSSRAYALRRAYIEERKEMVRAHLPPEGAGPALAARQTPCPAPITTPSGTKSPRFAHSRDLGEMYPIESRRLGEEGLVMARVRISPTGCVTAMAVAGSSGSDLLDKTVLQYFETVQFIPAGTEGHAVETTVMVPIEFKLTEQ